MFRIGQGYDIHRFEAHGKPLILSGVTIPFEKGIVAHSDGDVVLHAVCDALLGALGAGDIGQHFPDSDPRYHNQPSDLFVKTAYEIAQSAGYTLGNLDVTIITEKPKLKAHIPAMKETLAEILGVSLSQVSIKAKTNEQQDAIGAGQAIAAQAVVLLIKNEGACA